jgi:ribosomal protein S18 acetylase RimI-like enzyme
MDIIIEQASVGDAEEILELQKLAYRDEAAIYDDYSIPPLKQTLGQIRDDFAGQTFLKATLKEVIVGSVRAFAREGTCYIGRLIVHPDCRNRGIGTRLMYEIEGRFNGADRYELFTGEKSERNLYLYRKLGYAPCKRHRLTDKVTLVYLEKTVT